ncbi:SNF2-related N-terminal domain [Trinorchestia longiramus]|nr:SNF2-related N-terminal domain [Trinorchestia longiramus]
MHTHWHGLIHAAVYSHRQSNGALLAHQSCYCHSCQCRSQPLIDFDLFGVRREGRVLIADDMGLGKTIQALGIAACYRRDWPLLIVAPSSVRYSWQNALERWISSFNCCVINTSNDPLVGFDVIITSYDLLSRRAKEFVNMRFGVIIMDESHMLKNFKSARYKASAPLVKRASRVILLSGTPALSRPSELYTQISSVDNKLFPNHQDYGIRYCAGKTTQWGWDFTGSSNLTELQILLQSKIMIRRLKTEVLDQLPGKQRKVIMLDPTTIEKSSNEAMTASAKQLGLLKGSDRRSALLQFFSHTAHAKLQAVSDYVTEMLEEGRKFLVFAHHKVMLEALCQTCERCKAMYIRVEGSTAGDVRQALVDEFQKRDDVRVAVLSITAASSGITLTAAKLVVFAELYWNPGILVQAEDRVHRIGQSDSVDIHYLVAGSTADDYIWPMVQQKLNVLGKAGLSKDDFSDSDATNQKRDETNTLLSYLENIKPEDIAEMEQDYDDDTEFLQAPTKKLKTDF